ncbi:uncharacterized protein LOC134253167 [Saccostrea cucullata]|uniref:uncharacterized protein LOC134253167 n=1 Tax=Saccostrea cuccullata TaxID=36930 RepID=UPI002ED26782
MFTYFRKNIVTSPSASDVTYDKETNNFNENGKDQIKEEIKKKNLFDDMRKRSTFVTSTEERIYNQKNDCQDDGHHDHMHTSLGQETSNSEYSHLHLKQLHDTTHAQPVQTKLECETKDDSKNAEYFILQKE